MWAFRPLTSGSLLLITALIIIIAAPARAQLSPGDLSSAHEELEGLKKCSNCHQLGKREVGPRCLDCHVEIKAMREGGRGLHAGDDFGQCVDCHVEHHGRDYELVFWPDGRENFKHDVLGYEMTGAHLKLACRQCHNVKNVVDPGKLRGWKKEFDRTYLGLAQDCLSCHADPHAGALTGGPEQKTCTACHGTEAWKPASGFDHDRSAFPLTGRHQKVDCAKCHRTKGAPVTVGQAKVAVAVFKPQAHAACTDCHKDPHVGTLGPNCTQCHVTDDWLKINGQAFDHSRTKYPLEGRHAGVSCAQCHDNGRKKPAFAACRDCHADAHDAATLERPKLMVCEDCHTVAGFRPAGYTMTRHAESAFPLRGGHQATPCLRCHQPSDGAAARRGVDPKSVYARAANLAPAHAACTDCHRDPHAGQTAAVKGAGDTAGCIACHDENSWRDPRFDHGTTRFALDGGHARAACTACHKPGRRAGEVELLFKDTARNCAGCHDDIHQGQFADRRTADGAAVDCARCHVTVDWFAEKFDHETDSRFPLRGGHEKVACATCHIPRAEDEGKMVRFKPLPTDCRSCHGNDGKGQP
ncbi:hypothetical protein KDM41_13965 [bacterium]|nr:hypothetical protein [bacterium]